MPLNEKVMNQLDLFDETLELKILRMEKWIGRLQKDLWFLKSTYEIRHKVAFVPRPKAEQLELFKG